MSIEGHDNHAAISLELMLYRDLNSSMLQYTAVQCECTAVLDDTHIDTHQAV